MAYLVGAEYAAYFSGVSSERRVGITYNNNLLS